MAGSAWALPPRARGAARSAAPGRRSARRWSRGVGAPGGDDPFAEAAAHDRERAGGRAVVVQRCALVGQPGEQPDLRRCEVGVQRRVEHRRRVVRGEQVRPPAVRPVGDEVEPAGRGSRERGGQPGRARAADGGVGGGRRAGGVLVIGGFPGVRRVPQPERAGRGRSDGGGVGQRAGQSALATRPRSTAARR